VKARIASAVLSLVVSFAGGSAMAQAGSLDPAFGNGGIVVTNFGPLGNFFETNDFSFSDAALAPNGDLVVAGSVTGLDNQQETAVIVRYLPNGTLDNSFGSNGVVTLPAPASFASPSSFVLSVTVQPNGKILTLFGATSNTGTQSETVLLRLNLNGEPDTTFGTDGQIFVAFPEQAPLSVSANIVLAQPDGKILVGGAGTPPFRSTAPTETILARYLSNGAPDTTFGHNGFSISISIAVPSALALLSGDGILAGNSVGQVAQFSAAGSLVGTPTGGAVIATKNTGVSAFESNGSYLIAGTTGGPDGRRNIDARIVRFLDSGAVDQTFSSPAISFGTNGPLVKSEPAGIAVDSNGKVTTGGIFITPANGVFGLARVNPTGAVDTTFGSNGAVNTQVALEGSVFAVLVQPDNKIIAIGEAQVSKSFPGTTEGLGIARYLAK